MSYIAGLGRGAVVLRRGAANLIRILIIATIALGSALAAPAPARADEPVDKVTVGVYINDLQDLDLATDSYTVDFYLWMRWRNPKIDPSQTIETMNSNAFQNTTSSATGGVTGKPLYPEPIAQPDGSRYQILRYQGVFSRRMNLEKFPFDTQNLVLVFEDSIAALPRLEYVPDTVPVALNQAVTLPGYFLQMPTMKIAAHRYPTNFGDLGAPSQQDYSRIIITLPAKRDVLPYLFKIVLPILIVVLITSLIYLLPARLEEARAGIGITAMLTIVALQWTTDNTLPSVDYLMMVDLIYILSLFYVFVAMGYTVVASRRHAHEAEEAYTKSIDRKFGVVTLSVYVVVIVLAMILYRMHHHFDPLLQ
ncbi:MAG: hypothetical protein ACKOQ4_12800 [Mycobacterium sp.]